jgi:hypothetical protein
VLLSACLGAPVVRDGRRIGELGDLVAAPGVPAPVVTGVVVRSGRRPPAWVDWSDVERLSPEGVVIRTAAEPRAVPAGVLLARDVLDAQLVDLAGHRVVRVGDVHVNVIDGQARVEGVEAGLDSVLERVGLRRLARRARHHTIAWGDLHLPVHPGAALTIETAARAQAHLARRPIRFPTHVFRRRRAPS